MVVAYDYEFGGNNTMTNMPLKIKCLCTIPIGNQIIGISHTYVLNNVAYLCCDNNSVIELDVINRKINVSNNVSKLPTNYRCIDASYGSLISVLVSAGIVNCIAIWENLLPYNNKDMCNSLTAQMNDEFRKFDIKTELTLNYWRFYHHGKPITLQEVFELIPDSTQLNDATKDSSTGKIIIKEEWYYKNIPLEQSNNMSIYSVVPDGTRYFYECSYICPTCKRKMNKALIKDNVFIKANHTRIPLGRVFSCKLCHHFITNYENQPLSNGEYWYLPVAEERYKKLVKVFDEFGRPS